MAWRQIQEKWLRRTSRSVSRVPWACSPARELGFRGKKTRGPPGIDYMLWFGQCVSVVGNCCRVPSPPLAGPTTLFHTTDVSSLSVGHQQVTQILLTHNDPLIFSSPGGPQPGHPPHPPLPCLRGKAEWLRVPQHAPLPSSLSLFLLPSGPLSPVSQKPCNFSKPLSHSGK